MNYFFFIGMDNFESLLDGAHFMDKHFMEAPVCRNVSNFHTVELTLVHLGPVPPENCHLTVKKLPKT